MLSLVTQYVPPMFLLMLAACSAPEAHVDSPKEAEPKTEEQAKPTGSGIEPAQLSVEQISQLIVRQTEEEWHQQRSTPGRIDVKNHKVVRTRRVEPDASTLHVPIRRFVPLSGIERIYLPYEQSGDIPDAQVSRVLHHAIVVTSKELRYSPEGHLIWVYWTDGRRVNLRLNWDEGRLTLDDGTTYCFQVPTKNTEQALRE